MPPSSTPDGHDFGVALHVQIGRQRLDHRPVSATGQVAETGAVELVPVGHPAQRRCFRPGRPRRPRPRPAVSVAPAGPRRQSAHARPRTTRSRRGRSRSARVDARSVRRRPRTRPTPSANTSRSPRGRGACPLLGHTTSASASDRLRRARRRARRTALTSGFRSDGGSTTHRDRPACLRGRSCAAARRYGRVLRAPCIRCPPPTAAMRSRAPRFLRRR